MEYKREINERRSVLHDCIQFRHAYRVPHFSNFFTWKILDSELHPKLSEALADYGMLDRIQCEFQERYGFDVHYDLLSRNLLKPSTIMGGHHHLINDEQESINFFDHQLMEDNEYPDYKDHRWEVSWRMFLRKYPELTQGTMAKAIAMNAENIAYVPFMTKKMAEEYGCPACFGGVFQAPYERFHKYYRGIKAGSMDLRRRKAELIETFDAIQAEEVVPAVRAANNTDTSRCMADYLVPLLAHSMMNIKQFETFYWPYLKEIMDEIHAADKTVLIFLENTLIRFKDFFQDYPKGFIILVPELDTVTDLREAVPNAAIIGGLTTDLLGRGTPEECVEETKRVINAMGDGFIVGQNKMVSFRNDCRRENLLAVSEYLQQFRW